MLKNEIIVELDGLLDEAKKQDQAGYRLLTATGLDEGDHFEIIYHLASKPDAKGASQILNLRIAFPKDAEVPSLTGVFPGGFLIENEMKELVGIKIIGISIDYGGRLFMTEDAPAFPLAKGSISAEIISGKTIITKA